MIQFKIALNCFWNFAFQVNIYFKGEQYIFIAVLNIIDLKIMERKTVIVEENEDEHCKNGE